MNEILEWFDPCMVKEMVSEKVGHDHVCALKNTQPILLFSVRYGMLKLLPMPKDNNSNHRFSSLVHK